jgi:hypothetical protein
MPEMVRNALPRTMPYASPASECLSRFTVAFRMELRLLMRNWVYPLLHLLLLALLVYMFLYQHLDNRSAQALLESSLGFLSIGLISLAALFTAGASASRSSRARFAEMESALPNGMETLFGRWFACLAALAGFLVAPLIVAFIYGPPVALVHALPLFLFEAVLTIAFTCSVSWWLHTRWNVGRWAYPLLAGGWLAFLAGPVMLYNLFPPVYLFNFMRQGSMYYSELFRRLVHGDLPFYFNVFYLGLLVLLLGMIAWRSRRLRFHKLPIKEGVLALAGLVLAGFGMGGYFQGALTGAAAVDVYFPLTQELLDEIPPALVVEAYHLALDLEPEDSHSPKEVLVNAVLVVRNEGPEPARAAAFNLFPSMHVEVSNHPSRRYGPLLIFDLSEPLPPGESLELTFVYSGELRRMGLAKGLPYAFDFAGRDGVRLTTLAYWYPIAFYEGGSRHSPARMLVEITGGERLNFAANIPQTKPRRFESQDATWLFLIGSPHLVQEQIGDITLVTARNDLERARQLSGMYSDALSFLLPYFPDVPYKGMILMVLGEESGLPNYTPPSDGKVVVVISRPTLSVEERAGFHSPFVSNAVFYDLWALGGGDLSSNNFIPYRLSSFLSKIYKNRDDQEAMLSDMDDWLTPGAMEWEPFFPHLLNTYLEQGEAGLTSVMREIRLNSSVLNGMEITELRQWLDGQDSGAAP